MGEGKVQLLSETMGAGCEDAIEVKRKSLEIKEEDDALDGVIEDGAYDNP